jgi:hypothetical protein
VTRTNAPEKLIAFPQAISYFPGPSTLALATSVPSSTPTSANEILAWQVVGPTDSTYASTDSPKSVASTNAVVSAGACRSSHAASLSSVISAQKPRRSSRLHAGPESGPPA